MEEESKTTEEVDDEEVDDEEVDDEEVDDGSVTIVDHKYKLVSIHGADSNITKDQLQKLWEYDLKHSCIAFGKSEYASKLKTNDILLAKYGVKESKNKQLLGIGIVKEEYEAPNNEQDKERITKAGIPWIEGEKHPYFVKVNWFFEIPKDYEIPSIILNHLKIGTVNPLDEWAFFAFLQNFTAKNIDFWQYQLKLYKSKGQEKNYDTCKQNPKGTVICCTKKASKTKKHQHDKRIKSIEKLFKYQLKHRTAVWLISTAYDSPSYKTIIPAVWYGSDIRNGMCPPKWLTKGVPARNAEITIKIDSKTDFESTNHSPFLLEYPVRVKSKKGKTSNVNLNIHVTKDVKGNIVETHARGSSIQLPFGGTLQNINDKNIKDDKGKQLTNNVGYHYCTYRDLYYEIIKDMIQSFNKPFENKEIVEMVLLWINTGIKWWEYNPTKEMDKSTPPNDVNTYFKPNPEENRYICDYGDQIPQLAELILDNIPLKIIPHIFSGLISPTLIKSGVLKNLDTDTIIDIFSSLKTKKQIIFQGPPGTGKTYLALKIAKTYSDYKLAIFHQSYSYEEFIEGFKPSVNKTSKQLEFNLQDGIFREIFPIKNDFLLIIDEINRGQTSSIFGELMYGLEYRTKQTQTAYQREKLPDGTPNPDYKPLIIPDNLYIIGTMNTADKSIAIVDYALRRRFRFINFKPIPAMIDHFNAKTFLEEINVEIQDTDLQIGHTFFMNLKPGDKQEFERILRTEIKLLLKEYEHHLDTIIYQNTKAIFNKFANHKDAL